MGGYFQKLTGQAGVNILQSTTLLTVSQIRNLHAAPVMLLPALPSSLRYLPIFGWLDYFAGSIPYGNNAGGWLACWYMNDTVPGDADHNSILFPTDNSPNLAALSNQTSFTGAVSFGAVTYDTMFGSPFGLTFSPQAAGELTNGDGTMQITILFQIHGR
jgi:hypothetical protein